MSARREPNSRLRDVIDAVGCTYEALARDVRRIAAENGEILQTNKSAVSHWVKRSPSAFRPRRSVPCGGSDSESGTHRHAD